MVSISYSENGNKLVTTPCKILGVGWNMFIFDFASHIFIRIEYISNVFRHDMNIDLLTWILCVEYIRYEDVQSCQSHHISGDVNRLSAFITRLQVVVILFLIWSCGQPSPPQEMLTMKKKVRLLSMNRRQAAVFHRYRVFSLFIYLLYHYQ